MLQRSTRSVQLYLYRYPYLRRSFCKQYEFTEEEEQRLLNLGHGGFAEVEEDNAQWPPRRWENLRPQWYEKRSEFNLKGRDSDTGTLDWFLPTMDENKIVGRAWFAKELRIKSFEDLHKLWWVLVRERNMLESIRFQCRAEKRLMPNYQRLVKVKKSMARLKTVVNERSLVYKQNLINIALKEEEEYQKENDDRLLQQRIQERAEIKKKYGEYLQQLADRPEPEKIDPRQPSTNLTPDYSKMSPFKYVAYRTEGAEDNYWRMKKYTSKEANRKGIKIVETIAGRVENVTPVVTVNEAEDMLVEEEEWEHEKIRDDTKVKVLYHKPYISNQKPWEKTWNSES